MHCILSECKTLSVLLFVNYRGFTNNLVAMCRYYNGGMNYFQTDRRFPLQFAAALALCDLIGSFAPLASY